MCEFSKSTESMVRSGNTILRKSINIVSGTIVIKVRNVNPRDVLSVVLRHQVCLFLIWQLQETSTPLLTFFFYRGHLSSMRRAVSLFSVPGE